MHPIHNQCIVIMSDTHNTSTMEEHQKQKSQKHQRRRGKYKSYSIAEKIAILKETGSASTCSVAASHNMSESTIRHHTVGFRSS